MGKQFFRISLPPPCHSSPKAAAFASFEAFTGTLIYVLRGGEISAKSVFDAVKAGDQVAIEIAAQFGEYVYNDAAAHAGSQGHGHHALTTLAAALPDQVAIEIAAQFGEYLGKGLAAVAGVVNPEIFVMVRLCGRWYEPPWAPVN